MNVSRRRILALLAAGALAQGRSVARAQGFSGLGIDAGDYAPVVKGRPLAFPSDHGAHTDYRIEWWYITANLRDAGGTAYGVQWTLFRQAMAAKDNGEGWQSRQLWMAHAALTTADQHHAAERLARGGVGQAGVTATPFTAWIDEWQIVTRDAAQDGALSALTVSATAPAFSYRLMLSGNRPVVLQGEAGYSRKSEREQASYYYSQPFLQAQGTLQLSGTDIQVTGEAWIDHEWSSQPLAADQNGWDWFSLHLSSGDKLMLFRLRHRDGSFFISGKWIGRDGRTDQLANDAITLTPAGQVTVANRVLPRAWQLNIPSHGFSVTATPLNPLSWMTTRVQYWEGPITIDGSHSGVGYLEMTGY